MDLSKAMIIIGFSLVAASCATTAAEDEPETPQRAISGLTGWIDCYPECRLAGTLFCGGVDAPRTIEGNDKLQEAYNLGMGI